MFLWVLFCLAILYTISIGSLDGLLLSSGCIVMEFLGPPCTGAIARGSCLENEFYLFYSCKKQGTKIEWVHVAWIISLNFKIALTAKITLSTSQYRLHCSHAYNSYCNHYNFLNISLKADNINHYTVRIQRKFCSDFWENVNLPTSMPRLFPLIVSFKQYSPRNSQDPDTWL